MRLSNVGIVNGKTITEQMKTYISILSVAAAALMVSCGGGATQQKVEEASLKASAQPIASLIGSLGEHVGDTLVVSGTVRHTCKHSGRRCFVSGEDRSKTVRIESGGNIGGFNKELIGSDIVVRGVVKEVRTTKEQLVKARADMEAQKAQGIEPESCESSIGNIDAKLAQMEQDGRDFWSDYYVQGIDMEN